MQAVPIDVLLNHMDMKLDTASVVALKCVNKEWRDAPLPNLYSVLANDWRAAYPKIVAAYEEGVRTCKHYVNRPSVPTFEEVIQHSNLNFMLLLKAMSKIERVYSDAGSNEPYKQYMTKMFLKRGMFKTSAKAIDECNPHNDRRSARISAKKAGTSNASKASGPSLMSIYTSLTVRFLTELFVYAQKKFPTSICSDKTDFVFVYVFGLVLDFTNNAIIVGSMPMTDAVLESIAAKMCMLEDRLKKDQNNCQSGIKLSKTMYYKALSAIIAQTNDVIVRF